MHNLFFMRASFVGLVLLVTGQIFGQSSFNDSKEKTDSLNAVHYKKLKSIGQFNSNGSKTGFWIEYDLLVDTADNSIPVTIQGLDFSMDMQFSTPSTTLIKSEGDFVNGQMTNTWKWFKASYIWGDTLTWGIIRETEYLNGKKNGTEKQYSSGDLFRHANYLNDQITGTETYYWSPDIIYLRAQWKNGNAKNAIWYYPSGGIKTSKDYRRYPLIKVTDYHENGKVKAKYTVLGAEEVIDGGFQNFDENGKLKEKKRYKEGIEVKK